MKDCADVDAIMTAFVDGEVPAREVAEIRAHLDQCPPCRQRATAERTAREVVRARAAVLGGQASESLRQRCQAAAPVETRVVPAPTTGWSRVRGWAPLSMAAGVLLALGVVFVAGQNQRLEAAFAAQLAIDHDRCFTHLDDIDPVFGQIQAEGDAEALAGVRVPLPAESDEFDLVDVRECLYDAGAMVHVLCRWRGAPVSLFVVPGDSRQEQVLEIVGHDAVIWSESDRDYVLVAEHGPVDIGQVAGYVRGQRD